MKLKPQQLKILEALLKNIEHSLTYFASAKQGSKEAELYEKFKKLVEKAQVIKENITVDNDIKAAEIIKNLTEFREIKNKFQVIKEISNIALYGLIYLKKVKKAASKFTDKLADLAIELCSFLSEIDQKFQSDWQANFTSENLIEIFSQEKYKEIFAQDLHLKNDMTNALSFAAGHADQRNEFAKTRDEHIKNDEKNYGIFSAKSSGDMADNFNSRPFDTEPIFSLVEKTYSKDIKNLCQKMLSTVLNTSSILAFFANFLGYKYSQNIYYNDRILYWAFSSLNSNYAFTELINDPNDNDVIIRESEKINSFLAAFTTLLSTNQEYNPYLGNANEYSKTLTVNFVTDTLSKGTKGLTSEYINGLIEAFEDNLEFFEKALEFQAASSEIKNVDLKSLNDELNRELYNKLIQLDLKQPPLNETKTKDLILEIYTDCYQNPSAKMPPTSWTHHRDVNKDRLTPSARWEKLCQVLQFDAKAKKATESLCQAIILRKFQRNGIKSSLSMLDELEKIEKEGKFSAEQKQKLNGAKEKFKETANQALKRDDFVKWLDDETVLTIIKDHSDIVSLETWSNIFKYRSDELLSTIFKNKQLRDKVFEKLRDKNLDQNLVNKLLPKIAKKFFTLKFKGKLQDEHKKEISIKSNDEDLLKNAIGNLQYNFLYFRFATIPAFLHRIRLNIFETLYGSAAFSCTLSIEDKTYKKGISEWLFCKSFFKNLFFYWSRKYYCSFKKFYTPGLEEIAKRKLKDRRTLAKLDWTKILNPFSWLASSIGFLSLLLQFPSSLFLYRPLHHYIDKSKEEGKKKYFIVRFFKYVVWQTILWPSVYHRKKWINDIFKIVMVLRLPFAIFIYSPLLLIAFLWNSAIGLVNKLIQIVLDFPITIWRSGLWLFYRGLLFAYSCLKFTYSLITKLIHSLIKMLTHGKEFTCSFIKNYYSTIKDEYLTFRPYSNFDKNRLFVSIEHLKKLASIVEFIKLILKEQRERKLGEKTINLSLELEKSSKHKTGSEAKITTALTDPTLVKDLARKGFSFNGNQLYNSESAYDKKKETVEKYLNTVNEETLSLLQKHYIQSVRGFANELFNKGIFEKITSSENSQKANLKLILIKAKPLTDKRQYDDLKYDSSSKKVTLTCQSYWEIFNEETKESPLFFSFKYEAKLTENGFELVDGISIEVEDDYSKFFPAQPKNEIVVEEKSQEKTPDFNAEKENLKEFLTLLLQPPVDQKVTGTVMFFGIINLFLGFLLPIVGIPALLIGIICCANALGKKGLNQNRYVEKRLNELWGEMYKETKVPTKVPNKSIGLLKAIWGSTETNVTTEKEQKQRRGKKKTDHPESDQTKEYKAPPPYFKQPNIIN